MLRTLTIVALSVAALAGCAATTTGIDRTSAEGHVSLSNVSMLRAKVWLELAERDPDRPHAASRSLLIDGPWTVPPSAVLSCALGEYPEYRRHTSSTRADPSLTLMWWVQFPPEGGEDAPLYALSAPVQRFFEAIPAISGDRDEIVFHGQFMDVRRRAAPTELPREPRLPAKIDLYWVDGGAR